LFPLQIMVLEELLLQKLNESNPNNHESFATEATARRIELLNYNKKDIVSIQLIDLHDENITASGTSVILTIQLNE
jgi:hypothetical protein